MEQTALSPRPELAWIPVAELTVDAAYQRKISDRGRKVIRTICDSFSWSSFGALTVGRSDDGYSIIDGQHRTIAAREMNLEIVPCVVVNAGQSEQARGFAGINGTRTSVTAVDKFRAKVIAGDPEAIKLSNVMSENQIDVDVAPGIDLKIGQTRSIGALERLSSKFGLGVVGTTLEMLREAQPENPSLLSSHAIQSTAVALDRIITSEGDLDVFDRVLQETDFEDLAERCRTASRAMGGSTVKHAATRLIQSYNHGRKIRVSEVF